jgi:hypothetical protein
MTNVIYVVAFSGILTHSLHYLVTQYLPSVSCFSFQLPDITLVGKTRTWSSNSKWVKRAHKIVKIYNIVRSVRSVRSVRHVRVLPRPL